jgi:hypothetical protein
MIIILNLYDIAGLNCQAGYATDNYNSRKHKLADVYSSYIIISTSNIVIL